MLIVGYETEAFWDLWIGSIQALRVPICKIALTEFFMLSSNTYSKNLCHFDCLNIIFFECVLQFATSVPSFTDTNFIIYNYFPVVVIYLDETTYPCFKLNQLINPALN